MKQNVQSDPREARDDELLVLGIASIETHGALGDTETVGIRALPGISEA
jgi:hypothetical protein